MLDYKPCCKFVILQCITVFFTINLFLQPLLRGGSVGSSLGSYRGSSGPTVSLSSPRHYPQQFGTPLRSQGTGNKLDRTPARLGNIFFLKAVQLGLFLLCRGSDIYHKNPLCYVNVSTKSIGWPHQVTLCLHSHHSVDSLSSIFISHSFPVYIPLHVSLGEEPGLCCPTCKGW